MKRIFTKARIGIVAAVLASFSIPLLTPSPASAWEYHPGWGWHGGYGWRHRCCWGPGFAIGVAPPVVVVPPPIVPRPVWIGPHWDGGYWIPGHWG